MVTIGAKVVDGSLQGNLEYIHGIVGWVEVVHLPTLNIPYYKMKDNVFMSMLMKLIHLPHLLVRATIERRVSTMVTPSGSH